MVKLALIFVVVALIGFAATRSRVIEGASRSCDLELSNRDFTGRILWERGSPSFSGKAVYGSCFSQEKPDTKVFPDDLTGATFLHCNLDNVLIPAGNTVVGGLTRRHKIQPDGRTWLVDSSDQPIRPLNPE